MSETLDEGLPLDGEREPAISDVEAHAAAGSASADRSALVEIARTAPVTQQFTNIDQTVIAIAEDRARLILADTVGLLRRGRDWLGPAGLFSGLGACLLTGDFKDFLGMPADTVAGMVIAATIAAGTWTAVKVVHAARTPSASELVDRTIDGLKHGRRA